MRRLVGMMVVMVGCVVVVGCSSVSPEPVVPLEPRSVWTPLPEPTPSGSPAEQGAIDAVYAYLDTWTRISQNLQETSQWVTIRDVAIEPLFVGVWKRWEAWYINGWHLDGGPEYEVTEVHMGSTTEFGVEYRVYGCYIITDSQLVDAAGNPVGEPGVERSHGYYVVLRGHSVDYRVTSDVLGEGTC